MFAILPLTVIFHANCSVNFVWSHATNAEAIEPQIYFDWYNAIGRCQPFWLSYLCWSCVREWRQHRFGTVYCIGDLCANEYCDKRIAIDGVLLRDAYLAYSQLRAKQFCVPNYWKSLRHHNENSSRVFRLPEFCFSQFYLETVDAASLLRALRKQHVAQHLDFNASSFGNQEATRGRKTNDLSHKEKMRWRKRALSSIAFLPVGSFSTSYYGFVEYSIYRTDRLKSGSQNRIEFGGQRLLWKRFAEPQVIRLKHDCNNEHI